MSLEESDAHRDRVRDVMADELPAPCTGALARAAGKNVALARRRAAARRRADEVAEAAALGVAVVVKLTVNPFWTTDEDAVVRALYPDYTRMVGKLPHRSRCALESRAAVLDLKPQRKLWTSPEVAILRQRWTEATAAELVAALPRWSMAAIYHKARTLSFKPRGRPPLALTGNSLCDEIRDRCRVLGYSMSELDRMAHSGTYFSASEWKRKAGHRPTPMIRAVNALGGTLKVEWPD